MNHTKDRSEASRFFENWTESFSAYELVTKKDGTEDLRILEANRTFANLISADYKTLPGCFFTDVCPMALEWLPFYIDCAKTGAGNINESYNYDLQKYLTAVVFSPQIGQVVILVMDRTHLWEADQRQRGRDKDLGLLFASMSSGFCLGKIIRNEQGEVVDALFEMVNNAFEILEGFPTATLQGKRLFEVKQEDAAFLKYVEVVDKKTRVTFTKYVSANAFTLEVVCFSQGEDLFVCIENDISARVKAEKELKNAHETILSGIHYASKIQKNLLPRDSVFQEAFFDYSVIWNPRDIVGGDIYWLKNFKEGTLLCVCDCTGHGTPGALLTMLVASIFDKIVDEANYKDTAQIMMQLDQNLANVLNVDTFSNRKRTLLDFNDGCDLAILFVAKDGTVKISSGNMPVFVCDGKEVIKIKGQRFHIGNGRLESAEAVDVIIVPANPDNKFYIASDGLYDQMGDKIYKPFGYKIFKKIILEHHYEKQTVISQKIWEAFENHRGQERRRDDVELITFKP